MDKTKFLSEIEPAIRRLNTGVWREMINAEQSVLAKYQPLFSTKGIHNLSSKDFVDFLHFKNNRHWTNLDRQSGNITENIIRLREALQVLLDESEPIEIRFTSALNMVGGMGIAIATAILHIAYPDKYGVWNGTSERAMKRYGIFPPFSRRDTKGTKYSKVNEVLLWVSEVTKRNLWSVDGLWWEGKNQVPPREQSSVDSAEKLHPRYWTAYWKKSTAQRNLNEGHHFDHTGTAGHFEVDAGDIVYGITNVNGILHVLGRMEVGERVDAKRAKKLLGYNPWPADEHLVAANGTASGIFLDRRLDSSLVGALMIIRRDGIRPPAITADGFIERNSLRRICELTPQGARLLDTVLGIDSAPKKDELVEATNELVLPGESLMLPGSEGGRRSVTVTVTERNSRNRQMCLDHWGYLCRVCGFDFSKEFGRVAEDFIHVHHHNLIADAGEIVPDPINDMSPLCPNCHAVAHLKRPPYTVDELKAMRSKRRS